MITHAQAETIELLWQNGYGLSTNPDTKEPDALTFTPEEAFPARDNRDNGARRCVRRLAELNLLAMIRNGFEVRYRCTEATWQAYRDWLRANDRDFAGTD